MTRFWQLSWLLATSFACVAAGAVGGCSEQHKHAGASAEVPDAGSDVLDELNDPTPSVAMAFGRACKDDHDCGLELNCILPDSSKLTRGGPPSGLCTKSCAKDPTVCDEIADGALCVEFGDHAYCVQSCEYGTPDAMAFDPEKCHGRQEFACRPVLVNTHESCAVAEDCQDDEICDNGECHSAETACMPQCNGDFDCPTDLFCDPKTGECIGEVPGGLRLGESCRPDEDACRGVCAQAVGATDWRCAEPCTLGVYPSCGSPTDPAEVGCAIASGADASFGDLGWCARLCDCNDDCSVGLQCIATERGYLRRLGYCGVRGADAMVRATCPDEGSGGSGGSTSATSGSGGSGGSTSATSGGGTVGEAGSPASAGQGGESSELQSEQ